MDRRDFIKAGLTAAGTVAGAALVGGGIMALSSPRKEKPAELRELRQGKFTLRFYPYELQLAHSFTVSSYSRTTTPGVGIRGRDGLRRGLDAPVSRAQRRERLRVPLEA